MGKKVIFDECFIREDFPDHIRWKLLDNFYHGRQKRSHLQHPNIYDKDDVYYDKRTRYKKTRVRITIEEI